MEFRIKNNCYLSCDGDKWEEKGYENNFSQNNITPSQKPKRSNNVLTIIIACSLSAVIAAVFLMV